MYLSSKRSLKKHPFLSNGCGGCGGYGGCDGCGGCGSCGGCGGCGGCGSCGSGGGTGGERRCQWATSRIGFIANCLFDRWRIGGLDLKWSKMFLTNTNRSSTSSGFNSDRPLKTVCQHLYRRRFYIDVSLPLSVFPLPFFLSLSLSLSLCVTHTHFLTESFAVFI